MPCSRAGRQAANFIGDQHTVLICRRDRDERVPGMGDVVGPQPLHSLDVIRQASKAQPRHVKGEGSSRDKAPKADDGQQEAGPPIRITRRRQRLPGTHERIQPWSSQPTEISRPGAGLHEPEVS